MRLRNPRAMPRRCSRCPPAASVGPLEVRGWSKWARTSWPQLIRVLVSLRIFSSPSGAACFRELMSCYIRCFPGLGSPVTLLVVLGGPGLGRLLWARVSCSCP